MTAGALCQRARRRSSLQRRALLWAHPWPCGAQCAPAVAKEAAGQRLRLVGSDSLATDTPSTDGHAFADTRFNEAAAVAPPFEALERRVRVSPQRCDPLCCFFRGEDTFRHGYIRRTAALRRTPSVSGRRYIVCVQLARDATARVPRRGSAFSPASAIDKTDNSLGRRSVSPRRWFVSTRAARACSLRHTTVLCFGSPWRHYSAMWTAMTNHCVYRRPLWALALLLLF